MTPKTLGALRRENPGVRRSAEGAVAMLRQALGDTVEILSPAASEEPILPPATRAAVFEWMAERAAAAELQEAGLRPRPTALFSGPPGTGKTTLAHHIAARLGVPMVCVGSEALFPEPYLGVAERATANLFDKLKDSGVPCVLFLDELDSVGAKRGQDRGGGAQAARNNVLNILLRKIERFEGVLIGATNLPDALDSALWRRFGMHIAVGLPGEEERFAILARYARPWVLPDEDLDVLVDMTAGASPSLLRDLMEGMKRGIVLAPRLGRDVPDAPRAFAPVLAAVEPPPGMARPPLWDAGPAALAGLSWPPARVAPEGGAP